MLLRSCPKILMNIDTQKSYLIFHFCVAKMLLFNSSGRNEKFADDNLFDF